MGGRRRSTTRRSDRVTGHTAESSTPAATPEATTGASTPAAEQAAETHELQPLDVDGVRTVIIGVAVWAVALVALLPFYGVLREGGHDWWIWTCLAGIGLGLIGYTYCRHRRSVNRARAEAAADALAAEPAPTKPTTPAEWEPATPTIQQNDDLRLQPARPERRSPIHQDPPINQEPPAAQEPPAPQQPPALRDPLARQDPLVPPEPATRPTPQAPTGPPAPPPPPRAQQVPPHQDPPHQAPPSQAAQPQAPPPQAPARQAPPPPPTRQAPPPPPTGQAPPAAPLPPSQRPAPEISEDQTQIWAELAADDAEQTGTLAELFAEDQPRSTGRRGPSAPPR